MSCVAIYHYEYHYYFWNRIDFMSTFLTIYIYIYMSYFNRDRNWCSLLVECRHKIVIKLKRILCINIEGSNDSKTCLISYIMAIFFLIDLIKINNFYNIFNNTYLSNLFAYNIRFVINYLKKYIIHN